MPKISSQDYAIRLLRDLDQVSQIPPKRRFEVLQVLIAFARQIRSLPLSGEIRGRIGVHTMNAIFTIAEHDRASAEALRALAARVTAERDLGSPTPGISSSMPWPNPLDAKRGPVVAGGQPSAGAKPMAGWRENERLRGEDEQRRFDDAQSRAMREDQRRAMMEDDRRRMMEDQRRMMEDEERRRRDADRYR